MENTGSGVSKQGFNTMTIQQLKYTITIASLGVKVNKKLTVKQILNLKKVNVKKSANNLLLKEIHDKPHNETEQPPKPDNGV